MNDEYEVICEGYKRETPLTQEELDDIAARRKKLRHWLYEASDDCECDTCLYYKSNRHA